ncbi:MAG TPA: putative Ig domain-containing protein, partial [Cellvibrionaceae bacterium]|nr:putative Ig domain-containing protein [Cellvibrionaceae bacterium]
NPSGANVVLNSIASPSGANVVLNSIASPSLVPGGAGLGGQGAGLGGGLGAGGVGAGGFGSGSGGAGIGGIGLGGGFDPGNRPTLGTGLGAGQGAGLGSSLGVVERLPSASGLSAIPSLGTNLVNSGSAFSYNLPEHSFQAPAGAVVSLDARLVNGQPLPSWLRFDPQRGVLTGQPPAGLNAAVKVEIIIRDNQGRQASTVLEVKVGKADRPQTHWQPNHPQHLGDHSQDDALAALLEALDTLTGGTADTTQVPNLLAPDISALEHRAPS